MVVSALNSQTGEAQTPHSWIFHFLVVQDSTLSGIKKTLFGDRQTVKAADVNNLNEAFNKGILYPK